MAELGSFGNMSTHGYQIVCIGLLATTLLLPGCRGPGDAATVSAQATTLAPAIASYGSAYGVQNLKQDLLIASAADAEALAEEISHEQLVALSSGFDSSGIWVVPEWKYIGTKQAYHFLAYYPAPFGLRKIYRIRESQYSVTHAFELTAVSTRWRRIPSIEPEVPAMYQETAFSPWLLPRDPRTNDSPWTLSPLRYDLDPSSKTPHVDAEK